MKKAQHPQTGEPFRLEAKHIAWIFENAAQVFADRIKEIEAAIIRNERFIDAPEPTARLRSKTRHDAIQADLEALRVNRELLKFCQLSREKAADASAAEFAKAFWETLKH